MGIVAGTVFIIGTTLGAGFLSGAELIRFFGAEHFLPAVLLSSGVFFVLLSLFLSLGKKHGGFEGALKIFGRGKRFIRILLSALSFIPCAGMLAGLDALAPAVKPLFSLLGLFSVLLFLRKGMKGIGLLNLLLVPFLLFFVFYSARGGLVFSYPSLKGGLYLAVLYAGMNTLLAVPVLLDAGKTLKRPLVSAFLASAVIGICAVCVLGVIYREGAGAIYSQLPFLYAMRGSAVFCIASALAILTSLASALYPLLTLCEDSFAGKKKYAAKTMVLLAAFALSRMGLKDIVDLFYPVIGAVGIAFSAACILYEYLFEKRNQKVHCRRKHA